MPYSHSDHRHRVNFRQHEAADAPLPCLVIGIMRRVSLDYRWEPSAIWKVDGSRLCEEKKTAPGVTLACRYPPCFTKALLRHFGGRKPRRRGYNYSRNKVSHAVVGRLPPLFTGANFEVVCTVIFDPDERGCLFKLTWETEPGGH